MIEAFQWVLGTYGKELVCYNSGEAVTGRGQAVVQPMTAADRQYAAGALDAAAYRELLGEAYEEASG